MSIMRKDEHSGGIVFDLTPEEKELNSKVENIDELTKKLEEKLSELDSVLSTYEAKK